MHRKRISRTRKPRNRKLRIRKPKTKGRRFKGPKIRTPRIKFPPIGRPGSGARTPGSGDHHKKKKHSVWTKLAKNEKSSIRHAYRKWRHRLQYHHVRFKAHITGHGMGHTLRVLLYVLKMARDAHLNDKDTAALAAAAIFHDTRRENSGKDQGHGKRAAKYYKKYCKKHSLKFDKRAYLCMKWHDRADYAGIKAIEESGEKNGVLLYKMFKDADALDRLRFGSRHLDTSQLRTKYGKRLVPFAKTTVAVTLHLP